jgi:hypothetical protein
LERNDRSIFEKLTKGNDMHTSDNQKEFHHYLEKPVPKSNPKPLHPLATASDSRSKIANQAALALPPRTMPILEGKSWFTRFREERIRARAQLRALDMDWEAKLDMFENMIKNTVAVEGIRSDEEAATAVEHIRSVAQNERDSIRKERLTTQVTIAIQLMKDVYENIQQFLALNLPEPENERIIGPIREKAEQEFLKIMSNDLGDTCAALAIAPVK